LGEIQNGVPVLANTESWNGTSWTEVNDLNTAREQAGGAGTDNTSALAFGGNGTTTLTESWNGTNWTNENNMNTGARIIGFSWN
jgi:hypothetical protein